VGDKVLVEYEDMVKEDSANEDESEARFDGAGQHDVSYS
jgi:hypothetical protein